MRIARLEIGLLCRARAVSLGLAKNKQSASASLGKKRDAGALRI